MLLQKGGPLVIRRLCAAMGPEVVFREFASILDAEEDLAFAATMVQVRQGYTYRDKRKEGCCKVDCLQPIRACWCEVPCFDRPFAPVLRQQWSLGVGNSVQNELLPTTRPLSWTRLVDWLLLCRR